MNRTRSHVLRPGRACVLAAGAILLLAASGAGPAAAQDDLGGQRVGTSSASFLKIGLDARGAALGGAYGALVEGPAAVFANPARMLTSRGGLQLQLSQVRWPADLTLNSLSATIPFTYLGVRLGVGLASLGTTFDETTEFHPQGTGRSVAFSDFVGTVSGARAFTDRLSIGVSVKYFREDLGSNVGGPVCQGFLLDAGSVYDLRYANSRFAVVVANFGADLDPEGGYDSHLTGSEVSYTAFSPPTQFQLAFALDPWSRGRHRLTTTAVILHQSDDSETIRGGLEYRFAESYALRAGHDFQADELGFSAGLGAAFEFGGRLGSLDYAWTQGGHLEAVHRVSLGLAL